MKLLESRDNCILRRAAIFIVSAKRLTMQDPAAAAGGKIIEFYNVVVVSLVTRVRRSRARAVRWPPEEARARSLTHMSEQPPCSLPAFQLLGPFKLMRSMNQTRYTAS